MQHSSNRYYCYFIAATNQPTLSSGVSLDQFRNGFMGEVEPDATMAEIAAKIVAEQSVLEQQHVEVVSLDPLPTLPNPNPSLSAFHPTQYVPPSH